MLCLLLHVLLHFSAWHHDGLHLARPSQRCYYLTCNCRTFFRALAVSWGLSTSSSESSLSSHSISTVNCSRSSSDNSAAQQSRTTWCQPPPNLGILLLNLYKMTQGCTSRWHKDVFPATYTMPFLSFRERDHNLNKKFLYLREHWT